MNDGDIVFWDWKNKANDWHKEIEHILEKEGCPIKVRIKGRMHKSMMHGEYYEIYWTNKDMENKTKQDWWAVKACCLYIKQLKPTSLRTVNVFCLTKEEVFP